MNNVVMLDKNCVGLVIDSKKHGIRVARISAKDYTKIKHLRWRVCFTGAHGGQLYVLGGQGKEQVYLHRLIMDFPGKGFHADHINEDGLNNSRTNLQVLTHGENIWKGRDGKNKRY